MTYAALLDDDSVRGRYLAVLTPRRRVVTWTVVSGFVYEADFSSFPKPTSLEFDGVAMTEVQTSTPNAGEWYYETATKKLRLRTPQSADPDSGQAVAFYPLYVATAGGDSNWHSNPLDTSTETVFFEPVIAQAPQIRSTISDVLFGFLPVQSSNLVLINAEHFLEPHLYDSSFNRGSVKIYHALGDDLDTANTKLIYDGIMSDINYTPERVTIKMKDRVDEFSEEYRNATKSFYNTTDFPSVNPNFVGKPIRYVWGYVQGFVPVNVSYDADAPTTSDNRTWCFINETTGISDLARGVTAGAHTTTRTFISFAEGIQVGDTVWLDRVSGTDEYVEVTAVNYGAGSIDHAAIATPMASGDTVRRSFVSRIEIIQNNVKYLAKFGRDYTTTLTLATSTCAGIVFSSSLEANLSMPATLSPNDRLSCTVYGRVNDLTAGGPAFGSNDTTTNNITNPVMIIYDILRNRLGIPESGINLTTFASVRTATASEGLGMAVPKTSNEGFKSYKNILIDIMRGSLLRMYLDNDLKWTISRLAPLTTATGELDSQEILDDFDISIEHQDIVSDILVEYGHREVSSDLAVSGATTKQVTATSTYARHVHKVERQQSFQSFHFRSADAQTLANRLSYTLGDRQATYGVKTRNRFFGSMINDTITLTREKLPGFTYTAGTTHSRDVALKGVTKGLRGVSLEADDQKGIQDNSGSW